MTDREKLIELIKGAPGTEFRADRNLVQWGSFDPTAEQIADHLISNGVTVQKWIPASEPPKKHGAILAVFKYGRCKPFVEQITYRGAFADEVTHWMPRPEAPKEEKE